MKEKTFNIVIVGVGGQGQITLLRLLSEAVLLEKKEVKTSELHGLSQRGGAVEVHLRFGKKVYSPLISQTDADLVIALELQESLRALYYTSEKTQFLINDLIIPIAGEELLQKEEIFKSIKKFTSKIEVVPASRICKEKLGNEVLAGVYLLSYACHKKLLPLKPESLFSAIKKIIPEKYLEINTKAFNLASQPQ